jgi:flagellar biosynthetic protein FlhB
MLLRLSRATFVMAGGLTEQALWRTATRLAMDAAHVLAPFALLLMGAALVASWAQTGPLLALEPLKPDLARLNPATGLRRLTSGRTLFDGAKAILKLLVLAGAGVVALHAMLPRLLATAHAAPMAILRSLVEDTAALGLRLAVVLGLIAVADLVFTRREFARRMRMSRRELKDEVKHREGDPRIRARLRELRVQLLKRSRALRNTRQADVLLTNPTRFAVALRYTHGEMEAPLLVAKGAGKIAAAMRALAQRNRIVVVQSPALTRQLFRYVDVEQTLPPQFHAEVARIIVWVFAQRQRAAAGASA